MNLPQTIKYLAIVSPDSIFKLAWKLNSEFDLNLKEEVISAEGKEILFFADKGEYSQIVLIKPSFLKSQKLKKIDFIIAMNEADFTKEQIKRLNNIQSVTDAKPFLYKKDIIFLENILLN